MKDQEHKHRSGSGRGKRPRRSRRNNGDSSSSSSYSSASFTSSSVKNPPRKRPTSPAEAVAMNIQVSHATRKVQQVDEILANQQHQQEQEQKQNGGYSALEAELKKKENHFSISTTGFGALEGDMRELVTQKSTTASDYDKQKQKQKQSINKGSEMLIPRMESTLISSGLEETMKQARQYQKSRDKRTSSYKNYDSNSSNLTGTDIKTHYPTPFNCHGDFCELTIQDPEKLKSLLKDEELAAINKRKGLGSPPTSPNAATKSRNGFKLPMKSIAIARKEKRGYLARLGVTTQDEEKEKSLERYRRPKKGTMGVTDPLKEMNDQHGGVTIGMYYQHVHVCSNCFKVYRTLDQARELIQAEKSEEKKRRQNQQRKGSIEQNDAARDELIARLCTKRGRPRSRNTNSVESSSSSRRKKMTSNSPVRSARKYLTDEVPKVIPSASQPIIPTLSKEEIEEEKVEQATSTVATAIVKAADGATITREKTDELKSKHEMKRFDDLDSYLRGTRKKKFSGMKEKEEKREREEAENKEKERQQRRKKLQKKLLGEKSMINPNDPGGYKGHVLLVDEDEQVRSAVVEMLEEEEFIVTEFNDAPPALEISKDNHFDLLIVSTELETLSGVEMTKTVRKREKKMDANLRRLPIVAFTYNTAPEDLRMYMEVGMDGCISKPVDKISLINTVRAAIPHHRPSGKAKLNSKVKQQKPMRPKTTGLVTSSDVAKLSLPVPSRNAKQDPNAIDNVKLGMFQMDADTAFPYVVMGEKVQGSRLFNFVVVHDFFDTYETMQIFMRPILQKYPGLQILLFNLPGQAFTEWRRDIVLNNEYYVECLEALLRHVDYNGSKEFETRGPYATPFYLMGFGNGANIATYFAHRFKPPNLRSVLSLNGFSHIDPHLAGILHDCMNVFSCSPATRPDLPVYFYTRFLFSSSYLSNVSAPLALNLYTAVHNPITLEGRMQICKGSLAHVDLRDFLSDFHAPIILVHSAQDGLVKPLHVEPFVKLSGGEVHTIRHCLKERRRPCVIWFRSGHEVFQECRESISDLVEQLVVGYHEKHDVKFLPHDKSSKKLKKRRKRGGGGGGGKQHQLTQQKPGEYFEDRFIDNVLGTLEQVRNEHRAEPNSFLSKPLSTVSHNKNNNNSDDEDDSGEGYGEKEDDFDSKQAQAETEWDNFRDKTMERTHETYKKQKNVANDKTSSKNGKKSKFGKLKLATATNEPLVMSSFDPTKRNFDWNQKRKAVDDEDNFEKLAPMKPVDLPEVREFMQWRVARNKKRLAKLVQAANVIQKAWRAYLAKTLVQKLRRKRAALFIQSKWRAKLARDKMHERRKEEWAVRLVQRCWRGKAGREHFLERRAKAAAARNMQRIFRGRKGKQRVHGLKERRKKAARKIQNMVRARIARCMTWKLREKRNAALDITRVFRGYKGRVRARIERDKYLFSKSQSQGITFGRQMLLEHKLHGTRLQSEVSLLTREKVETEERVEALLSEIAEFDKGVRALEKEMHELTAVETEAKGVLDEEARIELREQKMRLDREFGVMLGKIADRKERLKSLEVKLQTIDRTRQGKEEELRDLERKLVVLLEEQQMELEQIKRRQETRGELALPEKAATLIRRQDHNGALVPADQAGGYSGPTALQQQQANNLMQSTESLMKFGFMSMSLTYFSSLNMIKAMRKVGAVQTIMNGADGADITAQNMLGAPGEAVAGAMGFRAKPKAGEMPDKPDRMAVATWTVEDVGDWLETLKLGQYRNQFADAAIDGAFLYDLSANDLSSALGISHSLHCKKILNSIAKLRRIEEAREAEAISNSSLSQASAVSIAAGRGNGIALANGGIGSGAGGMNGGSVSTNPSGLLGQTGAGAPTPEETDQPISEARGLTIHPDKLWSLVRHGKYKDLKSAFENLPDNRFDENDMSVQYIEGFGTQYRDELQRSVWHINKPDEHGNTLLIIACQNNRLKIAKLLVEKGANPNHQNNHGNCSLAFAMEYQAFDLAAYLTDPDGAGARDDLLNAIGNSPYDGLG